MQPLSQNEQSSPKKRAEIEHFIRKNKIEIALSLMLGPLIIVLLLVYRHTLFTEMYIPALIIFSIIFILVRQTWQNLLFIRRLELMLAEQNQNYGFNEV